MSTLERTRPRPLQPREITRIAGCCSHSYVPPAPASWGYRWYDLGGESPPFYLRRFERDGVSAAISLVAPLERLTGSDAEPGALALARVAVTVGVRTIGFADLLHVDVGDGAARELLDRVLDELACLDLMPYAECPVCDAA